MGVDFVILPWKMTQYFDGDTKEWLKKSTTKMHKVKKCYRFWLKKSAQS